MLAHNVTAHSVRIDGHLLHCYIYEYKECNEYNEYMYVCICMCVCVYVCMLMETSVL